jgi:hypothetical protein
MTDSIRLSRGQNDRTPEPEHGTRKLDVHQCTPRCRGSRGNPKIFDCPIDYIVEHQIIIDFA